MRIVVFPHDPAWAPKFEAQAERIRRILSPVACDIHHIGSTAIPGIHAKPVIDMLLVAACLKEIDDRAGALAAGGYEAMGEFGIPGRRFFRKDGPAGAREYHLHAFAPDSAHAERHLAFRDFLIAHPETAREYSDLKRRLAERYPSDPESYMNGKDPFIKSVEQAALLWRRSARS